METEPLSAAPVSTPYPVHHVDARLVGVWGHFKVSLNQFNTRSARESESIKAVKDSLVFISQVLGLLDMST
jgi:hypothetical protein